MSVSIVELLVLGLVAAGAVTIMAAVLVAFLATRTRRKQS